MILGETAFTDSVSAFCINLVITKPRGLQKVPELGHLSKKSGSEGSKVIMMPS